MRIRWFNRLSELFRSPKDRALLLCGVISLAAFAVLRLASPSGDLHGGQPRVEAARIMERAVAAIRQHFNSEGIPFNTTIDPNRTGLVGEEYTEITTTLGSLEAKRTTTNPNMAGVVLQLLQEAGVTAGDTIGVGCSGSFPALMVATLAASRALGVHPLMILSLGSSSYGATGTDFTALDVYQLLKNDGVVDVDPVAVSLGGARDIGSTYEPEIREMLERKIRASGIPFLFQPGLQQNVVERMAIYSGPSGTRRIAAFVNIGGSYADLGTDPLILKLEPGLNRSIVLPSAKETFGVVFAMAEQHIPIIHLLYIKGLALKYGLPWDPVPLPRAGDGFPVGRSGLDAGTRIIALAYVTLLVLTILLHRKAFFRKTY